MTNRTLVTAALVALLLSSAPALAEGWIRDAPVAATVGTAAEFQKALAAAKSGQAIALKPGSYVLNISKFSRDAFVVVKSEDPAHPATVTSLIVRDSDHLWFQQLEFASAAKEPVYAVDVQRSNTIAVVAGELHGSVDGNHDNDANGANFLRADNIAFAGNDVHDLTRGVVFGGARTAVVSDNTFHHLRSDGADFAGVQGVLIANNLFTSFFPAVGDHPDFIQFWQRNALIDDTRDVSILGNTMLRGEGAATQSIFIGNHEAGLHYRNFVIENNVIYNSSLHGISLYDLLGARVANNTLVAFPGSKQLPAINLFRTDSVAVTNNAGTRLGRDHDSNTVSTGNIWFADTTAQLFADGNAGAGARRESFIPTAEGPLDRTGGPAGAMTVTGRPTPTPAATAVGAKP